MKYLQPFLSFLKSFFGKKKVLLLAAILFIPVIFVFIATIITYNYFLPELPPLSQLENISPKLVTNIYDKNGNISHEYFVERREWIPYDSIPKMASAAIIATEDRKFFTHWGVNIWAIPKAVFETVFQGKKLRGASTLTQQLTKLLFLTPERSITRKIKEAMTALRIEQTYTKEEILEFYMNEVYLGGGNYGFQSAGKFYFGRPLDSLTIPEYAMLAGMLQRPEAYRPDRHPDLGLERRNTVLYAMYDAGVISKEEYKESVKTPLIAKKIATNKEKSGLYFYEEIRKYMEKKYGENSLYADGVQVYSTIDPAIQEIAEKETVKQIESVRNRIKKRAIWKLGLSEKYKMSSDSVLVHFDSVYTLFKKEYLAKDTAKDVSKWRFPDSIRYHEAEGAVIVIENETGAIRAMVGGSDFSKSKWNRSVQSLRQPGSSFKPFVYAAAMDNGASTCDSVNDQPVTIEDPEDPTKTWRPANYGHDFEGMMTMRRALYLSKNLPAIQTGIKYGLNNVVSYARKFGIQKAPLQAVPSLALGSVGATLLEMASAYTVFPNGGTRIEPYMVDSIVDKNGELIEKRDKIEHEVLRPASAYLMVDMLKDVNIRGTAARVYAGGFTHPSGGKTGTTNDYTDAWYIGFTKQYTMAVWIGTDSPAPMGPGHTGTQDALPIWISVMTKIHEKLPKIPFKIPAGVVGKNICNFTGKLKGEFCNAETYCLYTSSYAPSEICDGNHIATQQKTADNATLFSSKSSVTAPEPPKKLKKEEKAPEVKKASPRKMF